MHCPGSDKVKPIAARFDNPRNFLLYFVVPEQPRMRNLYSFPDPSNRRVSDELDVSTRHRNPVRHTRGFLAESHSHDLQGLPCHEFRTGH